MDSQDTIAAIATAVGDAGIGIVRVSGPAAAEIARAVFRRPGGAPPLNLPPRRLLYGRVIDPADGAAVDEALLAFMPGPHSFTCEDVAEFQIHGGARVLQRLLGIILTQGARLALPGEFTQRAFLNGRIDLPQAEAVMDLIRAKTDASLKLAMNHLAGDLSQRIAAIRRQLLDFLAGVEAALDYPEEDVPVLDVQTGIAVLSALARQLDGLLASAGTGRILRDGLQTVIVGRPNVGKSSLLNAFLGVERALVTEVPGTTRDSIEEFVNLRDIPLRIIDTAGLRETADRVEQLGIQRTRAIIDSAALVLYLLDASEPFCQADYELIAELPPAALILVVNKTDLPVRLDLATVSLSRKVDAIVHISAKEKTGLDELAAAVAALVYGGKMQAEAVFLSNVRHEEQLRQARGHLTAALAALAAGLAVDCAVIDIRLALEALGQITGESVSDEVVREIFAKFCLGK